MKVVFHAHGQRAARTLAEVDRWSMILLIREAEVEDATGLIALLDQIGHESSFTSLDEMVLQ